MTQKDLTITIVPLSYEEARFDFFREQRAAAQRRMDYWKARIKPTSNPLSPEYEKTTQAADEWNYYNDIVQILEQQSNGQPLSAEWDMNGRCTNCGGHAPYWSMASTYYTSPYCFECGAKMRNCYD